MKQLLFALKRCGLCLFVITTFRMPLLQLIACSIAGRCSECQHNLQRYYVLIACRCAKRMMMLILYKMTMPAVKDSRIRAAVGENKNPTPLQPKSGKGLLSQA